MNHLKSLIREVPDFPRPGILFYDITTLLKDAAGLKAVIDGLSANYHGKHIDTVVGIEARGFIFGQALAYRLSAGRGCGRLFGWDHPACVPAIQTGTDLQLALCGPGS